MGDKIVVTGATGFIGRRLVPILLGRGYEVACIVRDPAKAAALVRPGVTLARGDIVDRPSLVEPMRGAAALFHLAGWYALGRLDQAKMHAINVEGARNALEVAAELGVPRIIHTSTVAVFGNTHGAIADESYRAPKTALSSEYERTKWEAHYEVAIPLRRAGAPITIVQPGVVTGAGDTAPHMDIFRYYLRRIPVMFGVRSGHSIAHVDDVAEGHVLTLERSRPGESYIIAGACTTYRQMFEMCESITGIPATRLWAPGWMASASSKLMGLLETIGLPTPFSAEALASQADYTYWGSAEKAKRELGWSHRPTEDVLREVLAYEQARMKR